MVDLFLLSPTGGKAGAVGTVQIGAGERVSPDAFRCRPYGTFCFFTTTNGMNTWLYNVSTTGAALISRTAIPGVILHNLSLDKASGAAYSVALGPNNTASVVQVLNQQLTTLVPLDAYMCDDCTVRIGDTTQCSDVDSMWVGIHSAGKHADKVVAVSLLGRKVLNVTIMETALPTAFWASCDDSDNVNVVGGAMIIQGGTVVSYGRVSTAGVYHVDSTTKIPQTTPPLVMSGLLSEPDMYDYFIALYPQGSEPGDNVSGFLAFGYFATAGVSHIAPLELVPISFYLTGSARVQ